MQQQQQQTRPNLEHRPAIGKEGKEERYFSLSSFTIYNLCCCKEKYTHTQLPNLQLTKLAKAFPNCEGTDALIDSDGFD